MTAITARPGRLRDVAEEIEQGTGLRVRIIGGTLVMSPTPRGKHAGTVRRLRIQLDPKLPADLGSYEVSSIGMPGNDEDYVTPALVVLPVDWDQDDEWLSDRTRSPWPSR